MLSHHANHECPSRIQVDIAAEHMILKRRIRLRPDEGRWQGCSHRREGERKRIFQFIRLGNIAACVQNNIHGMLTMFRIPTTDAFDTHSTGATVAGCNRAAWTKRLRRGSGERFSAVLGLCVEHSFVCRVILVSFRPPCAVSGVYFSCGKVSRCQSSENV